MYVKAFATAYYGYDELGIGLTTRKQVIITGRWMKMDLTLSHYGSSMPCTAMTYSIRTP